MTVYTVSMIKVVITDFSRVLLFPIDTNYSDGLNALNNKLLKSDPDYDFYEHFKLNEELLSYYKRLNLPVYIFTSETIQEHPAIKSRLLEAFSGIFSAKYLEVSKVDKDAYLAIANELDVPVREILYIDDNHDNIKAARNAGCETVLYTSNDDVYAKFARK